MTLRKEDGNQKKRETTSKHLFFTFSFLSSHHCSLIVSRNFNSTFISLSRFFNSSFYFSFQTSFPSSLSSPPSHLAISFSFLSFSSFSCLANSLSWCYQSSSSAVLKFFISTSQKASKRFFLVRLILETQKQNFSMKTLRYNFWEKKNISVYYSE